MFRGLLTMRVFLVLGFLFVGAWADVKVPVVPGTFGYHERVGIPAAERILKTELEIEERRQKTHVADGKFIDPLIVGGIISAINAHPHLAGLVINLVNVAGLSVCGSSLLTANRLVTAAHCWHDGVNQAWQFTVVLGSQFLFTGGTRIPTTDVRLHPEWTPSLIANDVAMIFLPVPVSFSVEIQTISLPQGNELFDSFVGEWGTAVGYGVTSDNQQSVSINTVVSEVNMQVISVPVCQQTFGHFVRDSNLCTSGFGGVSICGGDSGGPLFITRGGRRVLVGISSFVAGTGCEHGHPSAFVRVTSFLDFITSNL